MSSKLLRNLFRTRSQTLVISQDSSNDKTSSTINRTVQMRNISGFWLLGVTNLYCLQILLSAAHDLLDKEFFHPSSVNENSSHPMGNKSSLFNNSSPTEECNDLSTGVVLIAEMLPQLLMKLLLPFCYISPTVGITLVAVIITGGLLLIGFSFAPWTTFLSIVMVAVPTSIGEVVLLRYSSIFYGKIEMAAWAAGTGGGAILSSLIYSSLTTAGVSIRKTLLMMLAIPALMLISYWCILVHPKDPLNQLQLTSSQPRNSDVQPFNSMQSVIHKTLALESKFVKVKHFKLKLNYIKKLMPYIVPLALVYFSEYFINLGLYELIYFPDSILTHSQQYRWFMTVYQIAVFLSRTLGTFIPLKKHWLFPLLQVLNIAIFLLEVFFKFIPSIWIMLVLMFYEGLLGGAAYVNIFGKLIDKVIIPSEQEFTLSVVLIGDTLGACIAGCIALPVHDYICSHFH